MTDSLIGRREFMASIAVGTATAALSSVAQAQGAQPAAGRPQQVRRPASGLAEPALRPLRLGTIRPRGWLLRQLQLQADGLSGHLDEFWPDVAQSQWFGGKAEGWERAPYWLDGVIPLAWILGDQPLQAKVKR
jgi:uncharacterized protein